MRKEHLLLPWPTHEPPLEELDPTILFCFLALKMQYWAGSNSIPFPMGLLSTCTDGSGPASALESSESGQQICVTTPCGQEGTGLVGKGAQFCLGRQGQHLRKSDY